MGLADPRRGRFRSFLLTTLNHFLADEWDRIHAARRGSGQQFFSLDAQVAESRYRLEPVDDNGPEKIFERRWALTVLEQAAARLRDEYLAAGKEELFDAVSRFEAGESGDSSGAEMAARLGMPENTFKSHLRRWRLRHGELVRAVIAESIATSTEIDDEIQHLMAVPGG